MSDTEVFKKRIEAKEKIFGAYLTETRCQNNNKTHTDTHTHTHTQSEVYIILLSESSHVAC